jgi:flavodoxin
MNKRKLLEQQYNAAEETALEIVEEIGRHIIRENDLEEFVMGMGTWCFYSEDGQIDDDDPMIDEMKNFISEWDNYLHLTGSLMRFTADGPVITNW